MMKVEQDRRIRRRIQPVLLCLPFFLMLVSCGSATSSLRALPEWSPMQYAPRAPGIPWQPRPDQIRPLPGERLTGIPPSLEPFASSLTLTQLADTALGNTPTTREAWEKARAAATAWGAARGGYYPSVAINAAGLVNRGGGTLAGVALASAGAGGAQHADIGLADIKLSYLLLDFGGRGAQADSAEQALIAANWNHSQAIQDVLRNVARAYYAYLGARARVESSEANLAEARTSLEAVEVRRQAGVATVADLYQAQSNVAQAVLQLETDRGRVQTIRGTLATAVGWPANTAFDVAGQLNDAPLDSINRGVEELIDEAQRSRPDLAAVRAFVRKKEADLRQAESARWPTLVGTAALGTENVDGSRLPGSSPGYTAGVQLRIPVFQGGALENAVRGAQADLEAARAALNLQSQAVISDVWNAYISVRTAAQQVEASEALLRSAELAYEAALARYRAGATDIVELVTTQSTLARARSQSVNAQTSLFTSYEELIHAIGATRLQDSGSSQDSGATSRAGSQGERK